MATYSNEYSSFLGRDYNTKIWDVTYKDADDSIAGYIKEIKKAQADGNYAIAAQIMKNYGSVLKPYIINAEAINAISEEIHNLEVFTLEEKSNIFYQAQMPTANIAGDVWISSTEV